MSDGDNHAKNKIKQGFSGALASVIARNFAQPFDLIKIRFQLQVEPISAKNEGTSKYHSMRQAIRSIYREEGILAFWNGNVPAVTLSFFIGMIQFSAYEQFVQMSKDMYLQRTHPNMNNFFCGASAGIVATCIIQPIDVAKTRMISQDSKKAYRNLLHAFYMIYRSEGIRGLYRGLTPGLLEICPYNGMNFMFYRYLTETTMSAMNVQKRQQLPVWSLMAFGAMSACLSKLITYPLDTLKKRFHIQGFQEHRTTFGEHAECISMIQCIRDIIKREGYLSLYKGFTPSLWKSSVTIAVQFPMYDIITHLLKASTS